MGSNPSAVRRPREVVVNRPVALLILLASAAPASAGDCAPRRLVRMVVVDSSPGVSADSFAAKPKTIYRLGTRLARIEEEPDPEHNIHGLMVIAEPDSWIVNLADRTGRHVFDKDPKGVVRAPVFVQDYGDSFPAPLRALEFGCEEEFFDSFHGPVELLKGTDPPMFKQAVGANGWALVLLRSSRRGPPSAVFLLRGDDIVSAIRYLSYEEPNHPEASLFAKPSGIAFTEAGG